MGTLDVGTFGDGFNPAAGGPLSPLHAAALAYAAKGWPVFPCLGNGKAPACPNGKDDCTTDMARINAWWTANPNYNIGIVPGDNGLTVVDVDPRHGGDETVANVLPKMPETRRINTPSGGYHLWFKGKTAQIQTTGKLGPGVDTRCDNYVLMPPSHAIVEAKNGKWGYEGDYAEVCSSEPVDLPQWISDKMNAVRIETTERKAAEGYQVDAPHVIERARSYLRGVVSDRVTSDGAVAKGSPPVQGSRNADCVRHANKLGDFGCSEDKAAELLEDEWAAHGIPPDEPIADIVASAYRSRLKHGNEIGCDYKAPRLSNEELGVTTDDLETNQNAAPELIQYLRKIRKATPNYTPPPPLPQFMELEELDAHTFPPTEDVWQGFLPEQLVTLLYAEGGTGKTLLSEWLAIHVAAGLPLFGRPTQQMPVIMVLCEDKYERVRFALTNIREHLGIRDKLPITICCTPDDPLLAVIGDKGEIEHRPFLWRLCDKIAEKGPCLATLDTVSDIAQLNENLRLPPNALIKRVFQPGCTHLGSTMLVNCHPSAAQTHNGSRGSGSTAWQTAVRSKLVLFEETYKDSNGAKRLTGDLILSNRRREGGKGSYGECEPLRLRHSGVLFSVPAPGDAAANIDERAKRDAEIERRRLYHRVVTIAVGRATGEYPLKPRASKSGSTGVDSKLCDDIAEMCGVRPTPKEVYDLLKEAEREGYLKYRGYDDNTRDRTQRISGYRLGPKPFDPMTSIPPPGGTEGEDAGPYGGAANGGDLPERW